jgi:hypothetical protein
VGCTRWKRCDSAGSGWSCDEGGCGRGQAGDECAGGGVEEEVVAGGHDHQEHERRVERAERSDEEVPAVAEQAGGDDQRVADVHAGDGGVGVVDRADEAAVEIDAAARDRVDDADAGQARRRGWVGEKADEGEPARE